MTDGVFPAIRRVCRKTALGLLPTILLFLVGEVVQRVRYSVVQGSMKPMYYGFLWNDATPGPTVIQVNARTGVGQRLPSGRTSGSGGGVEEPIYIGRYDPEAINVLCLGGSSTFGVFNPPPYTYPYLLSTLLNETAATRGGMRFSVLNRGVPGHSAENYTWTLDRELPKYTPDVAIIYTGYNDFFIKDVNRGYESVYAKVSTSLNSAWRAFERYSLLAVTAKEKYMIWTANRRRDDTEERERRERLEREFKAGLRTALAPLAGRGVPLILIPEVLMARDFGGVTRNYENYAERYRNVPTIVREIAEEHGAEFIDLQKDFEVADYKSLFKDPVHLTDEGNRVLSRLIAERSATLKTLHPARLAKSHAVIESR